MMRFELQFLAALALDAVIGDPRWLPHPVRWMGKTASLLESLTRSLLPARMAGVLTWILVTGLATGMAWILLAWSRRIHPLLGDVVSVWILYTTLAARDLAKHSRDVFRALQSQDLPEARRRVGMIVGRDTEALTEADVTRGAVESVAENMVDGVTAPLLFAAIAGPAGAILYKAINTLDSMFGYKNERYLQFGWCSARMDDLANLLPSRLTAPVLCAAAWILRKNPGDAWRIMRRDARQHTSPNSGFAEAAMAGALGVQLGGVNIYFGKPISKPTLGDPRVELEKGHIREANTLMALTVFLCAILFLSLRMAVILGWGWGRGMM